MTEDSGVLPRANEADEYEQARAARPESDDAVEPEARPWDASEADLMEQTRSLPMTDEDEEPDER
jgi:hypothetical protein